MWTQTITARLHELWVENTHSAADIAVKLHDEFGVAFSRNAILGKVYRDKLPLRRTPSAPSAKKPKPRRKSRARLKVVTSPPIIEGPPVPPACNPITFMELRPHHCRFPIGERPYLFCGETQKDDSSYCAYHHGITHCRDERPRMPFVPRRGIAA